MAGVVRTPLVYCEIQYAGESDEQYKRRCERIIEENRRADEIEKAWAPSPMKGLNPEWDCGCWFSCKIHTGEWHPFCPRRAGQQS